jgi:hypothetical protein
LAELKDQTSATICQCLAAVITDLNERGFRVIGIVTDNARNEIKALKDLASSDFSDIAGFGSPPFIIRIACLSHTLNLVLVDFANKIFKGFDIYKDITYIRETLPREARLKLPEPCPTRWTTLGKFVRALIPQMGAVKNLIDLHRSQDRRREARVRWDRYNFVALGACLNIMDRFVMWTEEKTSRMAEAWPRVIDCMAKLQALGDSGNPYGHRFAKKLIKRMTGTASLSVMILSYLVTKGGVVWYQNLPVSGGEGQLSSQASVNELISGVLEQFRSLFTADPVIWRQSWDEHLARPDVPWLVDDFEYWSYVYERHSAVNASGQLHRCWLIALMAKILLKLPCSEAEVERIFSLMRSVFGTRGQAALRDLVEARLFLMTHWTRSAEQFCDSVSQQLPELEMSFEDALGVPIRDGPPDPERRLMADVPPLPRLRR